MSLALDHLVVAAPSLAQGVHWCEAVLGITPGPGGKHPLMGTHNRLFSIASEGLLQTFFEILAIDSEAAAPDRARWFGLDTLDLSTGPRLLHWVARSDELDLHCNALRAAGFDTGPAIAASRDTPQGRLQWRITVRDDGSLLAGGALPTLIDWGATPHPCSTMPASGVTLCGLTLRGVPAGVAHSLCSPGVGFAANAGPALTATLDTPRGRITLCST